MPKQKHYDFKRYQGASTPSTSRTTTNDDAPKSVNAILGELRIADDATASAIKQQLSENAAGLSLPPEVRRIVNPSEQPTPGPVARGLRLRTPRPAGPAPPSSWLRGDTSGSAAPTKRQDDGRDAERARQQRASRLHRFRRLSDKAGYDDTSPRSLLHLSMQKLTLNWQDLDAEHYDVLAAALPLSTRIELLCWLGAYADTISIEAVRALLGGDSMIQWLDLASLLNRGSFTTSSLVRLIKKAQEQTATIEPIESWDQEIENSTLSMTLSISRFSLLTHLCLSHPGPPVLWRDLLALTKYTPALTHLSIAYWPRPTLTPNLTTTTISHRHGQDIHAGGTHFYSGMDADTAEASVLLRQLSQNTLRLQWLDIEDVPGILPAMLVSNGSEGWHTEESTASTAASGLAKTWRNLLYVRVAGDRLPLRPNNAVLYFPTTDSARRVHGMDAYEAIYICSLCARIKRARQESKCAAIMFDLGWNYEIVHSIT